MRLTGRVISLVAAILASLQLTSSLEFSPPLSDTYIVLGKSLWWTCSVLKTGSTSTVTFMWRFQDGDISNDQTRTVYGNGTLYFPQVLNSHLGKYTCVVSDSQTYIESSAWLRQAYMSGNVTVTPNLQSVVTGGTAVLECRLDARPAPEITWRLGGQNIVKTSRVKITQVNSGHSMLQISNVSYSDAGSYTCYVSHMSLAVPVSSLPAVVSVYGPPVLTTKPRSQSVPVGYNATFPCEVISEPKSQVTWYFQANASSSKAQLSTSISSVSIDGINGQLVLLHVYETNSGIYTCSWTNQYGTVASDATLTVGGQPQMPYFVVRPTDVSVTEGDDVRLNCSGGGNPSPVVSWLYPTRSNVVTMRNGILTASQEANITIADDGSLTIHNVSALDMSTYVCVLTNPEGQVESRAFVDVLFKPYFESPMLSFGVSEGMEFSIPCDANGNPEPVVSWSLPGNPNEHLTADNAGADSGRNEVVLDDGGLEVKAATRAHHGVFTCTASNVVGSANVSLSVSVDGAPHFSQIPLSYGAIEGDSVELHCQIDAYPAATVEWYYRYMVDPSIEATDVLRLKESLAQSTLPLENMTILDAGQNPRYSLVNDTSLQILSVQESDAGLYICEASNDRGSAFEPAILRVITFPHFQNTPSNTSALIGSTVMLHCFAVGIPVPTQRWLFNQGKLTLNSRMSVFVNNGSLRIENITQSDFGTYTCLATNQAGQRSVSAQLTLSTLPFFVTPPSNTTLVEASNASLLCRGKSSSSFLVSWYLSNKNGDALQLIGQIEISSPSVSSLGDKNLMATADSRSYLTSEGDLFFSCLERSDSSWYMCSLTNADGSTHSDPAFLTVTALPGDMIVVVPEKVYTATSATLYCRARGYPAPVISWVTPLKTELTGPFINDMTFVLEQFLDYSTLNLTIRNVQTQRDGGQWACKACNDVGCRLSQTYLNIEGLALVRQIRSEEYDTEFSITCITTGLPEPDLKYSTGGVEITDLTDGHRVVNKVLFVEKDKIESEYTCQPTNPFGSLPLSFFTPSSVAILDAKPASTSVMIFLEHKAIITSLLPTQVLLQYKEENESTQWQNQTYRLSQDIDQYLDIETGALQANDSTASCENKASGVRKRDVNNDAAPTGNMKTSVTSTGSQFVYLIDPELRNLAPNTVYNIRAVMKNILGPGPVSSEIRVTTLAAAPAAVTNPVVKVYNRTASVSWTNPDPLNGRPEDTSITVKLLGADMNLISEAIISVLETPQTSFSGLQLGDYNVQIYASNKLTNTTSEVVSTAFQVRDEVPEYIPEINGIRALNSNIIQVNWTVPSFPTARIPPITGYMVELSIIQSKNTDGLDTPQVFNIANASISTKTIRDLQERTEYSVRVASTNSAGRGPYSEPKTVKTPYSEFSEDPLDDSGLAYHLSWKWVAVIVICVCLALIILTVAVIASHQIKLARSKSVDLNHNPEPNNNPETVMEERKGFQEEEEEREREEQERKRNEEREEQERKRNEEARQTRVAEGYTNETFMMY